MTSPFHQYKYEDSLPRSEKLLRLLWGIAWLIAFRPTPRWMLHGWRRFLLRLFGAQIGEGSKIAPSCFVWAPWKLSMGDYSALGEHVDCYTMDRITIGSKVAVSQRSYLCTGSHDTGNLLRPLITAPITIGDHCWIAAESFIMPGVIIGEGTVVGARSVVLKNMPPWTICGGHPCQPIKARILQDTSTLVQSREPNITSPMLIMEKHKQ